MRIQIDGHDFVIFSFIFCFVFLDAIKFHSAQRSLIEMNPSNARGER